MCGIIGIIGDKSVSHRLVDGLVRLEYRGYDSAGLAVLGAQGVQRRRAEGKIVNLRDALNQDPIDAHIGIAHTRWATHGVPSVDNAHPHTAGRVTLVHNGIIENYAEIRERLSHREFKSETDTETAAHLIDEYLEQGETPRGAVAKALKDIRGAYALGILIVTDGDSAEGGEREIYGARHGSPLAIGFGKGEHYLGSDALALAPLTDKIMYLEEGDWAALGRDTVEVFDRDGQPVARDIITVEREDNFPEKGNFPHFMLKEIYEQPETLAATLSHYLNVDTLSPEAPDALDLGGVSRVMIVACGTAFYAGMVAKYLFERVAGLAVEIDIASEFRYRNPVLSDDALMLVVSQSGETADTLAALRYAKEKGLKTAALVNVMSSSMAREADVAMPIQCGPEIGVASTKAFTSQVCALAALALAAAKARGHVDADQIAGYVRDLIALPGLVAEALERNGDIARMATQLMTARSAFFLGRGAMVPIAFEGALKLKEISYIHAEGYAAGELKHGPIALIEDGTPVIAVAPMDGLFEKTVSNLQEVAARGARVMLFTDNAGAQQAGDVAEIIVRLPDAGPLTAPIVQAIGQQLLAYYTAVELGTDVDQPRNLAKSVTVE